MLSLPTVIPSVSEGSFSQNRLHRKDSSLRSEWHKSWISSKWQKRLHYYLKIDFHAASRRSHNAGFAAQTLRSRNAVVAYALLLACQVFWAFQTFLWPLILLFLTIILTLPMSHWSRLSVCQIRDIQKNRQEHKFLSVYWRAGRDSNPRPTGS